MLVLLGFGIFLFCIGAIFWPKGRPNDGKGGGWWKRPLPDDGPNPLPPKWPSGGPPDTIPEWVVEEVGPVWIKPLTKKAQGI